ncbi:beta-glucosidase-like SFR2, chloroplastic [Curcuma longa]|uniref:beta-glucosidase-like SFR2, chloroplastic n=1 Tax=Curcuma longa TaxID=136217 RepID=UPI003D9F6BB5
MVLVMLVVSVTRIAGFLVVAFVATNALSYSRYRSKNLRPFRSPIDESADVLADFSVLPPEGQFFFGLATAPAHVEDNLNDAWLQFAEEQSSSTATHIEQQPVDSSLASATGDRASLQGSLAVASWHNVPHPKERLRFWSDPDIELKLAKDTGITVFRMGIDWARIMPREPRQGISDSVNFAALERYRWIIGKVRSYGMKVMLTLFHHSLPPWAGEYGGWKLEKTVDYFLLFTKIVVDHVADLVDYWVTFNEPHIFVILTYCAGVWPGGNPDMIEVATSTLPTGVFKKAMHWMSVAHEKAYDCIHGTMFYIRNLIKPTVGIAHHVSFTRPYGLFDVAAVRLANSLSVFRFVDDICDRLDFIGINYYGQEVISGPGLKLVDDDEYSESGRGIYPDGLFRILLKFHERYRHLNLPFIVTENGVSDETDLIRQPYLLEHLLAVYAAMLTGVRVLGYLFWTTSDNWEWADGYGPKFGLVAVDRANNLARIPRPSYYLFKKVAETRQVTKADRMRVWRELQLAAKEKRTRPFYRAVDRHGLMYAGGLDEPTQRPYIQRDWRFGHYEMSSLQDPVSRTWRMISRPFSRNKKAQTEEVDDQLLLPDAV